jgi:3-oxoacyl-[acyl-carrier-protein] synthase II
VTEGKSGIATITKFRRNAVLDPFCGRGQRLQRRGLHPAKEARHMDTFIHYGMAAGIQAMQDRAW